MLTAPIALILGAGSSRDFGPSDNQPFPLGDDLRNQISRALNIEVNEFGSSVRRGSHKIYDAYRMISKLKDDPSYKVGLLAAAGREIAAALPGCESIDDFLERHSDHPLYGFPAKLGISECILDAERRSPLRQKPENVRMPSIESYDQHWLARFLQGVTKGCGRADLRTTFSNLRVVNFNYDRCFEWFTRLWLRHTYPMTETDACELLRSMEVIHPYGSLGPLPDGHTRGTPFGFDPSPQELLEISDNILTYSESVKEDDRPTKIKEMVRGCSNYIFLGFAFHPQNMSLLDFSGHNSMVNVFTTTVGMPSPRWETAQIRVRKSLAVSKTFITYMSSDQSCSELIRHYGDRWVS